MLVFALYLTLTEMFGVVLNFPYNEPTENRLELFNLLFAYVFLIILQFFSSAKNYESEQEPMADEGT